MDKETANQLADELISSEKTASAKRRTHGSPRAEGNTGIGHFILPVVLSSTFTWVAVLLNASGLVAVASGIAVGIVSSHLIIKHII